MNAKSLRFIYTGKCSATTIKTMNKFQQLKTVMKKAAGV